MGCLIQLGLVGNNRRLQQTNSAREEGTTKPSMLGTPLENYLEAYQASLGFLNSDSLISIGTSSCTDCHGPGRRSPNELSWANTVQAPGCLYSSHPSL